jgi:hypothetical protein
MKCRQCYNAQANLSDGLCDDCFEDGMVFSNGHFVYNPESIDKEMKEREKYYPKDDKPLRFSIEEIRQRFSNPELLPKEE